GRHHIEPLSKASAETHESCTSVKPSSSWTGTPRMPNISHTANRRVKAIVDMVTTRPAPVEVGCTGGTAMSFDTIYLACRTLQDLFYTGLYKLLSYQKSTWLNTIIVSITYASIS